MPFLKCHTYKPTHSQLQELNSHKQGLRHAIFTPNKDVYRGWWERSRKEGYGQMITRSFRLYEGDWWHDYRHGFGVGAYRDDEAQVYIIEYRGTWKLGRYSGSGERHYRDGSFYRGIMKNSKRHQYGQMWYADGGFYDGEWKKDQRHGTGMMVYPMGNRYEGNWKDDMKHGHARYYHLETGQMQEGVWYMDNCETSFMEDIPFRQTAIRPTPYPIEPVEVINPGKIYRFQMELVLEKIDALGEKEMQLTDMT